MKLSYTVFMRAYTFFSILFFIFGALTIVIGGPSLWVSYEWQDPAMQSAVGIFRIIVIFFFGAGFVISSFILAVTRRRGFVAYKRMIDRLSSDRSTRFNLNISFPEQDEFGNLGKWLNKFMAQLRDFDKIKVERLRASQQKLMFLSEAMEKGIVILSEEYKINYVNSAFVKAFNIGDRTVVGLPVGKVIENDTVLETLEEIKTKPKNQVLEDLKIKTGETTYKVKVTVVPIISTEVTLMETLILFDYIQKRVINR